jgi:hypothetical protein
MATKSDLKALDKVLVPTKAGKDKKRRRVTKTHVHDKVAEALSKANSVSEIGAIAMKLGITADEIIQRANAAPNFGQFRMVIGNRIRGIARRIQKDKSLTMKEAAYGKAKKSTPAKKQKKVVKKKTKKAKRK